MATLDPTSALVVIDLQRGIVQGELAHPIGDVVANAGALAAAFRAAGRPVVLVTATGVAPGRTETPRQGGGGFPPDFADLLPELDAQSSDHRVDKQTWGAFTGTDLDGVLRGRGVTQVVLAGVATSAGVESTARHAHELGYDVALATDAMTDRSADNQRHSVEVVFPRLGERATTAELLAQL